MAEKPRNRRRLSVQDQFIAEFDALLAANRTNVRPAVIHSDNSGISGPAAADQLRSSHTRANAALGLHRGLRIAADSSTVREQTHAAVIAAQKTQSFVHQNLKSARVSASPLTTIAYLSGLALGAGSRLAGDNGVRKVLGSINNLTMQSQRRRAASLSNENPQLAAAWNEQADALSCRCGPHGHRNRSKSVSRAMTVAANLFDRPAAITAPLQRATTSEPANDD